MCSSYHGTRLKRDVMASLHSLSPVLHVCSLVSFGSNHHKSLVSDERNQFTSKSMFITIVIYKYVVKSITLDAKDTKVLRCVKKDFVNKFQLTIHKDVFEVPSTNSLSIH